MALIKRRSAWPPTAWMTVAIWLFAPACGATGAGDARTAALAACSGSPTLVNDAQLARASACHSWSGDLSLRGGAVAGTTKARALRSLTGTLHVGPTMQLTGLSSLSSLEEIDGSLVVRSNMSLSGVYLDRLQRINGDLIVADNVTLATLSLPALTRVAGALRITNNGALENVHLDALTTVGGAVQIGGNRSLELMIAPKLDRVRQLGSRSIRAGHL